MGTRHITAVVAEGEFVVAQYGQWDGYPTGAGNNIATYPLDELPTDSQLMKLEKDCEQD